MYTNNVKKHSFENRNLWGFSAVRTFSREVSKAFKLEHTKYLHLDGMSKLSQILR